MFFKCDKSSDRRIFPLFRIPVGLRFDKTHDDKVTVFQTVLRSKFQTRGRNLDANKQASKQWQLLEVQ